MQLIPLLGLMAAAVLVVFVGVQLAGPRFLDYRISEKGLEMLLFRHVPVCLVPLERITEVSDERPGKWDYILALRLGNRFVGPPVLVRTRRPLMWRILITPNDPDELVRRFRELRAGKESRLPGQ